MVYNELKHILKHFRYQGDYVHAEELQAGNINATYRLSYTGDGKPVDYILQRINTVAFHEPVELMNNVQRVIDHIAAEIVQHARWAELFYENILTQGSLYLHAIRADLIIGSIYGEDIEEPYFDLESAIVQEQVLAHGVQ